MVPLFRSVNDLFNMEFMRLLHYVVFVFTRTFQIYRSLTVDIVGNIAVKFESHKTYEYGRFQPNPTQLQ